MSFVPRLLTPGTGVGLGIALGFALITGGCAYYNLFYNAERAFEEGEEIGETIDPRDQPTSSQRTKYQTAIRKCQLELEEYPDSAYIDDALFLMAKSHFRLREWSDAVRNFDNLLANFPNSPFVEETMYLKSLSHLSRGEESVGLEWFARLRESYPDGRFGIEALYRLGDAYAEDLKYDEAIRYYGQYLEQFPDHEDRGRVMLAQARVLATTERYAEVVEALAEVDRDDLTKSQAFEVEWLRLNSLNEIGRSDEAADGLEDLEDAAELPGEKAKMLLLTGQIQLSRGDREEGVFTLTSLAEQYKDQDAGSEAHSAILEHVLKEDGPGSDATADALAAATAERPRGAFGNLIRQRRQQLERYRELEEAVAAEDSNSITAAFQLAEMTLIDFERPRDALASYRALLDSAPDSPHAPRAAYAVGYIESSLLENDEAAEVAFDFLREKYPESPQARALDGEIFLEAKPRRVFTGDSGDQRGGSTPGRPTSGINDSGFGDDGRIRRALRMGGPGASLPRDRAGR